MWVGQKFWGRGENRYPPHKNSKLLNTIRLADESSRNHNYFFIFYINHGITFWFFFLVNPPLFSSPQSVPIPRTIYISTQTNRRYPNDSIVLETGPMGTAHHYSNTTKHHPSPGTINSIACSKTDLNWSAWRDVRDHWWHGHLREWMISPVDEDKILKGLRVVVKRLLLVISVRPISEAKQPGSHLPELPIHYFCYRPVTARWMVLNGKGIFWSDLSQCKSAMKFDKNIKQDTTLIGLWY